MRIREIDAADLPEVISLLREGFPRRSRAHWENAFQHLQRRPQVSGFPRFGYAIEAGGLQGVMLLLTSELGNGIRSNLSSWYVRPAYRSYASFLFRRTLKQPDTVFLDISPSEEALPITEVFGFRAYTGGAVLFTPDLALRRGGGRVRGLRRQTLESLPTALASAIVAHLDYGCAALELEDATGTEIALYRIKSLKRLVPCAQFVHGSTPRLGALAGPLMRMLLRRGIPLALVDAAPALDPVAGWLMPKRDIRYARGEPVPATGDLLETELAIFGP